MIVLEQAVASCRRRLEVLSNQDGNDECVDGDNSGHDNGDKTLSNRQFAASRGSDDIP